jgi:hypothetical protein
MAVTIWNTADKSANVTVSGADSLTVTTTSATLGGARATNSITTAKTYFEVLLNTQTGTNFVIGWANATASLAAIIGGDKNGVSELLVNSGVFFFNNANLGTAIGNAATGQTVCIAFDPVAKLIWARINNGFWNNSASADPATGVGGASVSTINAGPYFPAFSANASGASLTAKFGATDFNYAIPAGFSALDTNTQAFNASSKFVAYATLFPPQTAASGSKFIAYAMLFPPVTAVAASKFVGYAVTYPILTGIASSKLISYVILSPPNNAISVSKLIGYAILSTNRVLVALAGVFQVTGSPANLAVGRVLQAQPGSFQVQGNPVPIVRGRKIVSGPGSFGITGQPVQGIVFHVLQASKGDFSMLGVATPLIAARSLRAGAGAFIEVGQQTSVTVRRAGGAGQQFSWKPPAKFF